MVDKKHVKIGVVVFAIAALVIGLSVGLTQKSNKSTNNLSSSQAYGAYDIDSAGDCYGGASGGSSKSSKSSSSSSSSKSSKSDRRALNVPGTEDAEASAGIRRKLRDQLVERELSSKSSKGSKGSKGSKVTKVFKESLTNACYCESGGKSGKSKSESKSKSGKSGGDVASSSGGKSGKSGGDVASSSGGKSEKSGGGGSAKSVKMASSSGAKSGKSAPSVYQACGGDSPPGQTETLSTQPITFSTTPDFEFEDIPSPSPTEGGTTTVATETDGGEDPQGDDRGGD